MKILTAELIIYQSASNLQGIVNTRLKTSTIRALHRIQGANQPPSKQTPQRGTLHSTADYRVSEPSNPQLGTLGSQRSTLTNCAGTLLRGMNLPQSTCPENEGTQRSWRIGKEGQLPGATRDSRLGRRTLRSG